MESSEHRIPTFCACSKTLNSIYSLLPFDDDTSDKSEEVNYKKFVLSDCIRAYPFSSTYIYCRFSSRKAHQKLKAPAKRMIPSHLKVEDAALKKDVPSIRSLLTLGICVVYTTVLFIIAAVGSRILSLLTKIIRYILRCILSTRLKSSREISKFSPRDSGT